jgi:hypothetical protein
MEQQWQLGAITASWDQTIKDFPAVREGFVIFAM